MKDRIYEILNNHQSSSQTRAIDCYNFYPLRKKNTLIWNQKSYPFGDVKKAFQVPTIFTGTVDGFYSPVENCSNATAVSEFPVFRHNPFPFLDVPKQPRRHSISIDLQDTHVNNLDIDKLLEHPLTHRQRSVHRPRRYRHNSGSEITARTLLPRRTNQVKTLGNLLSSLNLNELSLSAVHVAMGMDGSAQTISPEKEAYYRKVFDALDVDNDGKVNVTEMKQAYKRLGLLQVPGQAEKFVTASDSNKDGELDVTEFVKYLHEHEMKLKLMFKKIDSDRDGKISAPEMIQALKSVGLTISKEEANAAMKRMDKDGTSSIDLDEWVAHHLLHPSTDIKDIVYYWKHSTYIDIGENLLVPDEFTEDEKLTGKWWRLLMSGAVAGAVSRTCTAPLDRLKVLMQVHATKANNLGIKSGFNALLNEGGARGLWRGNGINVVKIAPETALKFLAFEKFKTIISGGKSQQDMGIGNKLVAGSLAGAFSQTCIYPMEVIKTRLALRKTGQYKGIFDCVLKIYANEGPTAFFKGYVPNLIGILPYAGIDLCIYETLRNYWVEHHSSDTDIPPVFLTVACGAISSTCGQLASYPFALIRTKMQAKATSGAQEKPTMFSLARTIFTNEGFGGFYRGIGPNFLKVAPAVSISYVVYENMKLRMGVS